MEQTIAEVRMFGGNFAPRGWALCQGQLLPIAQNTALFSLIGTTYGGDGRTTFGLPDCQGRAVIGPGRGPGLDNYRWGQRGGQEMVTLNATQIPTHNHIGTGRPVLSDGTHNQTDAKGHTFALDEFNVYTNGSGSLGNMAGDIDLTLANTGGNQPHQNMNPFQVINYIIALEGTFPSRS